MNRKITLVAAGAALATTAVGLGLDGTASARAANHTMTFKTHQITDKNIGSSDVATDKNFRARTLVGYDVTSCKINVTTSVAHCSVALARAAGLMYARAHVDVHTGQGSGVVTGGTRRFAGATGTVTVAGDTVTIHWAN
jgi:hypothetical protein